MEHWKNEKITLLVLSVVLAAGLHAAIKVSDVEVFSGYPWKEVVVGYTITGKDDNAGSVQLIATDKASNESYVAKTLKGAKLIEGRHVLRWDAAAEGVKFVSRNVVFTVAVMDFGGVQLWENGPYWAECNVGAEKPGEYGYYFWWGDTVGYKRNANGWVSVDKSTAYSFGKSDGSADYDSLTYNDITNLKSLGYIDQKGNLVGKYDAATVYLGAPWRLPTTSEWAALFSNCDRTKAYRDGKWGQLVTGRGAYASNSIFLPAAGYSGRGSDFFDYGSAGRYWSSNPCYRTDYANYYSFYLQGTSAGAGSDNRRLGASVRAVRGGGQ